MIMSIALVAWFCQMRKTCMPHTVATARFELDASKYILTSVNTFSSSSQ